MFPKRFILIYTMIFSFPRKFHLKLNRRSNHKNALSLKFKQFEITFSNLVPYFVLNWFPNQCSLRKNKIFMNLLLKVSVLCFARLAVYIKLMFEPNVCLKVK